MNAMSISASDSVSTVTPSSELGNTTNMESKATEADTALIISTESHTTSDSPESEEQRSHLFKVPLEIRNEIYRLALQYRAPLSRHPYNPYRCVPTMAALLRVNRMISLEASPVFYSVNIFRLTAKPPPPEYDDVQMECRSINVPSRHIPSLRWIILSRNLDVTEYRKRDWPQVALTGVELAKTLAWLSEKVPRMEKLSLFFVCHRPLRDDIDGIEVILRRAAQMGIEGSVESMKNLKNFDVAMRTFYYGRGNTIIGEQVMKGPGVNFSLHDMFCMARYWINAPTNTPVELPRRSVFVSYQKQHRKVMLDVELLRSEH